MPHLHCRFHQDRLVPSSFYPFSPTHTAFLLCLHLDFLFHLRFISRFLASAWFIKHALILPVFAVRLNSRTFPSHFCGCVHAHAHSRHGRSLHSVYYPVRGHVMGLKTPLNNFPLFAASYGSHRPVRARFILLWIFSLAFLCVLALFLS